MQINEMTPVPDEVREYLLRQARKERVRRSQEIRPRGAVDRYSKKSKARDNRAAAKAAIRKEWSR